MALNGRWVATSESTSLSFGEWLTGLGWVACPVRIVQENATFKKIIGHSGGGIKKSIEQFTVEDFEQNKSIWFDDESTGIGVICCENQAVENSWLIKIDLDCKGVDASESVRLKSAFYERFTEGLFTTVSGGLGVLVRCDFYVPHGVKIWFDNELIGNTSNFNVLPPSRGYVWLKDLDLGKVWSLSEIEALGIRFGNIANEQNNVIDNDGIPWDIQRYYQGLDLLRLAWECGLKGDVGLDGRFDRWGYDDEDYQQWLKVLLIGRGLDQQFGGNVCLEAFKAFSKLCGGDRYDENVIENEWNREDTGELGIATLEEWVKGIWFEDKNRRALGNKDANKFKEFIASLSVKDSWGVARNEAFKKAWDLRFSDRRQTLEILHSLATDYGKSFWEVKRDWDAYKDLVQYTNGALKAIPKWSVNDSDVLTVLRMLPGGDLLVNYGESCGFRSAVYLPLYLATMLVNVDKRYVRYKYGGKEIAGCLNVFLIAPSGGGKSRYTELFDCLKETQIGFQNQHQMQMQIYKRQLADVKKRNRLNKNSGGEPEPEAPEKIEIRLTNFTMPALLDAQRHCPHGVMIHLDEANTIFGNDVSGMKQSSEVLLHTYCKIWNGQCEGERRRGNGAVDTVQLRASMIAGLQTKYLKQYLALDAPGFFARSILITIDEVEEQIGSISQVEVIRLLEKLCADVRRKCRQLVDAYSGNGQNYEPAYPENDSVKAYLKEVWELQQSTKGSRKKHLSKVRDNFWNIVQALEVSYQGAELPLDWDVIYKQAIIVSKWLTNEFEDTVLYQAAYVPDEDFDDDLTSFKDAAWVDVQTYLRKNPSSVWSDCSRRLLRRSKYKNSCDGKVLQRWRDEWIAEGILKQEGKMWIVD